MDDLKGKRLGVAGGPLDKSWLMLVAYTLRVAFFDLRRETTPVFGAPPLLAEKLERGDIDAVLEYWPYAARLEGKGFKQLIAMGDLPLELGARGQVVMVGFVFSESWASSNDQVIRGLVWINAGVFAVASLANGVNAAHFKSPGRPHRLTC